MKFVRPTPAWLACILLAAMLLVTAGATSKLGRPFSGYYDVSGVEKQGDVVQVTLHLKLFNHGDEDLKGVIVTLMDQHPTLILRGNFQPVKVWKSQQFVQISQQFSVTQREYADWVSVSGQPNLVILFQDSTGQSWQRAVQVSRRPLVK